MKVYFNIRNGFCVDACPYSGNTGNSDNVGSTGCLECKHCRGVHYDRDLSTVMSTEYNKLTDNLVTESKLINMQYVKCAYGEDSKRSELKKFLWRKIGLKLYNLLNA